MARRTHVQLIDDLDGSSADETVTFGLDGSVYEVDLSAKHAQMLRDALAGYVANGRKSAIIRGNTRRLARAAADASGPDTAEVRSWARANGYPVNERGRIAGEIMDAYRAAH